MFARDLFNLNRQVNSLFNTLGSQYMDNNDDDDNLMMMMGHYSPYYRRGGRQSQQRLSGGRDDQQSRSSSSLQGKDESALRGRGGVSDRGAMSQSKSQDDQGQSQALQTSGGSGGLFSSLSMFPSMLSMSLDVSSTSDSYHISCDLPGVDKNSIDIEADKSNNTIKIKAEKKQEIIETDQQEQQQQQQVEQQGQSGGQKEKEKEKTGSQSQQTPSSTQSSSSSAAAGVFGSGVAAGQELSKSDTPTSLSRPRILRQERVYGRVERSLRLSNDADLDRINAKYESGVLKLTIPRIQRKEEEQQKKKKITVQ